MSIIIITDNFTHSLWTSPFHLAIAEAFAKENLCFFLWALANYCWGKIVLTTFMLFLDKFFSIIAIISNKREEMKKR